MTPADLTAALRLRPATPDDTEAIAVLWHRGWHDGHLGQVPQSILEHRQIANFRRRVPPRIQRTTVATVASRIVGFVTVHDDEVEQVYAGGFDYAAEIPGGTIPVPSRRYEKRLARTER